MPVEIGDGTAFVVHVLAQQGDDRPVVLVLPAMAAPARHYRGFVDELASHHLSVAICDLRGQGESTPAISPRSTFGYHAMVEKDVPAIVGAVRARHPVAPLYLFGHSLGGQVSLLWSAIASEQVAGVGLMATGSVHYRSFGRRALFTLLQTQAIASVAKARGFWAGGMLGMPGPQSANVMLDWARHARSGRYEPRGSGRDFESLLASMRLPILSVSFADDPYARQGPVDALCRKCKAATVTRVHFDASSGMTRFGHMDWLRDSGPVAERCARWIRDSRDEAG